MSQEKALLNSIYTYIKTLISDVSTVSTNVGTADSNINDLASDVSGIDTKIDTLDTVADNIYSVLGSGSGIPGTFNSIQRSTVTLTGISSNTATISTINMSKAVLHYHGCTTSNDATNLNLRLAITGTTTVTGYRGAASGGTDTSIANFEVESKN